MIYVVELSQRGLHLIGTAHGVNAVSFAMADGSTQFLRGFFQFLGWSSDERTLWFCTRNGDTVSFARLRDGVVDSAGSFQGFSRACFLDRYSHSLGFVAETPPLAQFDADRGLMIGYVAVTLSPSFFSTESWLLDLENGTQAPLGYTVLPRAWRSMGSEVVRSNGAGLDGRACAFETPYGWNYVADAQWLLPKTELRPTQ
jgi:hypothetical protein